ncbi:condensin complex subunit 2 [Calliphora vicina]|uniref:condensin complex subunit 2 n=1 Tax=Calliphora vicina TaxID=7373 RepID=UPI00325A60ED
MTPAHTDSPLRRSEVGVFRDGQQNVTINDDEEERRQARRRTLLAGNSTGESSTFEENETLKKCLEIYNGNKLSKENAWSLSLIDTLSTLLERHHKSLNNFKVAGSSLEASSKVYSLRVDSIHSDVLRMSAGLNAQKYKEKPIDDDDSEVENEVATGGDGSNDPNASAAGLEGAEKQAAKPKPKKQRKNVSTVTKNKDTLNARLDTVPLQDPVFGKLNSIVGSINSSNRLMNNILLTTESELRLRTTFLIWDNKVMPSCDYTEEVDLHTDNDAELAPCDSLFKMKRPEDIQLRPLHGGYVITDTPEDKDEDEDKNSRLNSIQSDDDDGPPGCDDMMGGGGGDNGGDAYEMAPFANANEVGMAFDINAECEPMPMLSEQVPIMDINYEELDDLTTEERTAINHCRGLRKKPILIDDLRPVDATSKLEYSYRPLDKISQFWAGPSHWKFKRARTTRTSLAVQQQTEGTAGRALNQRGKRTKKALDKHKSKQLKFGEFHDELFLKYDDKFKSRKANIQKKWDQRKLKLPVDLQLDMDRFFYYSLAPGLPVHVKGMDYGGVTICDGSEEDTLQNNMDHMAADDHHFGGDDDDDMRHDNMPLNEENQGNVVGMEVDDENTNNFAQHEGNGNDTILEIATDYEGAPTQVTKIIVPFAKRAKVIDMKNLKRSCTVLLTKQLKQPFVDQELPQHPIPKQEDYQDGVASFHEIYEHLPELLSQNMTAALSTSIAFYSVLHLANDHNLRLIPQQDLKDFKIRKVAG